LPSFRRRVSKGHEEENSKAWLASIFEAPPLHRKARHGRVGVVFVYAYYDFWFVNVGSSCMAHPEVARQVWQLPSGINYKLWQEDPPWESQMRKFPLVLRD
jgi:hypothetical protein